MLETLLGIERAVRPVQPLNARRPILDKEEESVISVRPLQFSTAEIPREVTLLGMTSSVRLLQARRA